MRELNVIHRLRQVTITEWWAMLCWVELSDFKLQCLHIYYTSSHVRACKCRMMHDMYRRFQPHNAFSPSQVHLLVLYKRNKTLLSRSEKFSVRHQLILIRPPMETLQNTSVVLGSSKGEAVHSAKSWYCTKLCMLISIALTFCAVEHAFSHRLNIKSRPRKIQSWLVETFLQMFELCKERSDVLLFSPINN